MKTSDFMGQDPYQENESKLFANDVLDRFGSMLKPKTYYERFKGTYNVSNFFTKIFPFLSGLTLFALVFFLSFNFDKLRTGELTSKDWFIGAISFMGALFAIYLNESTKTTSLRTYFKNVATKRKPPNRLILGATFTTIISIIGSSTGLYMLTYKLQDQSGNIESKAIQQVKDATTIYSKDSARVVEHYSDLIAQKKETIKKYNPRKYRTKIDGLNNEIIALTNTMEAKLEKMQARKDEDKARINITAQKDFDENGQALKANSSVAGVAIVVLELVNIFCHFFCWKFRVMCMIENGRKLSTATVQESAKMQYAESKADTQGLTPSPMQAKRNPIGFNVGRSAMPPTTAVKRPPLGKGNFLSIEAMQAYQGLTSDQLSYLGSNGKIGVLNGFLINCPECGSYTIKKAHNAKFCSKECRERHWEKSKGVALPHKRKAR